MEQKDWINNIEDKMTTTDIFYQMGFDDGKIEGKTRALEILDKYIHSPFAVKEQTLYDIKKELERI